MCASCLFKCEIGEFLAIAYLDLELSLDWGSRIIRRAILSWEFLGDQTLILPSNSYLSMTHPGREHMCKHHTEIVERQDNAEQLTCSRRSFFILVGQRRSILEVLVLRILCNQASSHHTQIRGDCQGFPCPYVVTRYPRLTVHSPWYGIRGSQHVAPMFVMCNPPRDEAESSGAIWASHNAGFRNVVELANQDH
jgi:hypothetical protein